MPFWKSVVPHDAELRQGSRKFAIGEKSFNGYENNKLWQNNGDGTFTEVGFVAGSDVIVDSRSCAVGDYDRDGRMDIALRTMYERSFFLRNEGERNTFLHVRLVGTRSNRMGVGARVEAVAGGRKRIAEIVCGSSFFSQHDTAVHFGLGDCGTVDRLVVRWPSGTVQEFKDVPASRFLTITEDNLNPNVEEPCILPAPKRGRTGNDRFVESIRNGTYTDLEGNPASAKDRMKDLTLLHVWSPTCASCVKEVPILTNLQKLSADGSFTVLAIAVDASREEARKFVEEHKPGYPVLVAEEKTADELMQLPQVPWSLVARGFGGWFEVGAPEPTVQGIPWSGLIDASGFQRRYRGPVKYFEAKLDIVAGLAELNRDESRDSK